MFILLSDTCIKNKLTRDYRLKLHPGTFQKYQLFLYLYVGGGTPPPLFIHLRYTQVYRLSRMYCTYDGRTLKHHQVLWYL
jgi:hypothetical protein